jgi:hypothetical protein
MLLIRGSITDLAGMLHPRSKCRQSFLAHHLNHGNLTLRVRLGDLCIDGGIIKADFGSVRCEIAKVNFVNPGPIDCAKAHRAGFAGGVEVTAPEFEAAKSLASLPDGQHFSMRCGIVRRSDLIGSFRYNDAFFDDDGAKRPAASSANIVDRELNGAGHESVVHVASFRHRGIVKGVPISATHESARKSVDRDTFAAAV